jgi:hypothetical protein
LTSAGVTTDTTISATGNITAPYFVGNGSALTGLTVTSGTQIVNGTSNVKVALNGNATVGVAGTTIATFSSTGAKVTGLINSTGNIDADGDFNGASLYLAGGITALASPITCGTVNAQSTISGVSIRAAGQIAADSYTASGPITATGSGANITGANLLTSGRVSASGNVTGNYILGNGSLLTGIPLSAAVIANGTSSVSVPTVNGSPNIISGGVSVASFSSTVAAFTVPIYATELLGNPGLGSAKIYNYKDEVVTITYASTITPNITLGSIQQVTLTGNVTMNAFGGTPQAGQSLVIKFIQDATGGRTLSSTMKWAGGAKTLSTAANAVDIASVFYDGTTYYASLTLAYA